jgi:hypothetical protein
MDVLSDVLTVRFDSKSNSLMILRPDDAQPLVQVRHETYSAMSFDEAAEFVGARILLLMPEMRKQFDAEIKQMASSETGKGLRKAK